MTQTMTSATLPYVTVSVVSTAESVQNSSATVDNNDNGYQKVVITVGVMVGAIIIAFIVAKIVDYCYDHTIAHRDDASDISEHTRNLIRARLVVSQFQKKANNDATDEEKEVERQKKVLRIWSEKGKLSRKIADQRRTEDQKKQTAQRHDLFTILDRATDDRKIASTLQRAAASLLVVSETHPVNRSPGIRRIKRTVLGFDSAPLDSGAARANPAPRISIVVTDVQDGHPPPASSLDSSAPNTSDDHRVPKNDQTQAASENSEGVLFQTRLDDNDIARTSGVDTVEGPNPPPEADFTSRERRAGQGHDQTAFPLNGQAGLTQVTENVDTDIKWQAPNPDQFSDAPFAPQEKETTLTIAGTKGNNSIKNSDGPHGTPGTLLSRKGPTTVVTSQPEERVRRARSAKNIKASQEQSRSSSTHARPPPANVTADHAQLGSTRASSRPTAKNVAAHRPPSESTNHPAQQAVKNVTDHATPSQRTNYVKNVTADHAALRSPSTPGQEKPRPKKSLPGTPSTTSYRTLAKVYRNTMGLTVHRPVTAKTRGQNSVQGSEELARPAENSSKSNQGLPLRVKSAK